MPPRLFVSSLLSPGCSLALPASAARHVQVLRLQPGDAITLFDGLGGEWAAQVQAMTRREVLAQCHEHLALERELARPVHLALAMPANDRMDSLIEKATELGAASIQPLFSERSVLRLAGGRAQAKAAHWQAVAAAACEQCGRNRVPTIATPRPLLHWLASLPPTPAQQGRWLLSLADNALTLAAAAAQEHWLLSGPEGGLSRDEERAAQARGFQATSLGRRILRADTAPLAALTLLGLEP